MQPCESRRNRQPETAETDFFILSERQKTEPERKTEVQGNERDWQ